MKPDHRDLALAALLEHLSTLPYVSSRPIALYDELRKRPNDVLLLGTLLSDESIKAKVYKKRRSEKAEAPLRAVRAQVKSLNKRIARWCRKDGRHWGCMISIEKSRDGDSREMLSLWVRSTPGVFTNPGNTFRLSKPQRDEIDRHLTEIRRLTHITRAGIPEAAIALIEASIDGLRRVLRQLVGKRGKVKR